ncbi:hypothetical protein AVEN_94083-1 [Araneus ventricosus]|uniref:Uncharacterized protein n=1 Tax=Araneus ventricosus TaxID=182803 RepID=A0A4Y2TB34_ARAVE|nr:hypothetical protein AVEN_94083-1 [Araneus ventricosus]
MPAGKENAVDKGSHRHYQHGRQLRESDRYCRGNFQLKNSAMAVVEENKWLDQDYGRYVWVHGTIYPHVLAVRGIPLDGWYISVPGVSIGWYPSHLAGLLKGIKRKSHSLGLGVKDGQRSWR